MAEDKKKIPYWVKFGHKRKRIDVIVEEICRIERGKANTTLKSIHEKRKIYRGLLGFNTFDAMNLEDLDNLILLLEKKLMLLYRDRAFPTVFQHYYGNDS